MRLHANLLLLCLLLRVLCDHGFADDLHQPQDEALIHNKTLVAWVKLKDLDQRGGSVLTLEDHKDRFDAIVYGELAAKKWMAGSEFFRRTGPDQSATAEESSDANELIQIAIAYDDRNVTIYRNGVKISNYAMSSEPVSFGPMTTIGAGKRHRRQSGDAHFSGAIDDLRVYSQALSQEQIVALKPNTRSDLPVWAWWNFEENSAKELTGRFAEVELQGGAVVENGMLILHAKSANFVARSQRRQTSNPELPARPQNVPRDWLSFHLAHPGPGDAMPGDPNCAFFWNGRYHLHYIYRNEEGFAFAHVSSTDLLHWKWHPTTLTPSFAGHGMFSGTGFYTKEGRPAIIYHGEGSGRNQISIALDDNLEQWTAPSPVEPIVREDQDGGLIANWDPDAWLDNGTYYALSGGSPGSGKPPTLFRSNDLQRWEYLGLFLTKDMSDVKQDEDISCPNFFKIGDRDMLLCISHTLGCRYYLGKWHNEKFTPEFHARMNWHGWDFFAPESVLTPDGRRVMWAWCNLGFPQSGIQSLPRELSLSSDGRLRIEPIRELATLRDKELLDHTLTLNKDSQVMPDGVGRAVELNVSFSNIHASSFGLRVMCDANGDGGIPISVQTDRKILILGTTEVPFDMEKDSTADLRVFIDKSMVEVFINHRQAAVASHTSDQGNDKLCLFADGGSAEVAIKAWSLESIY